MPASPQKFTESNPLVDHMGFKLYLTVRDYSFGVVAVRPNGEKVEVALGASELDSLRVALTELSAGDERRLSASRVYL